MREEMPRVGIKFHNEIRYQITAHKGPVMYSLSPVSYRLIRRERKIKAWVVATLIIIPRNPL